MEKSRDAVTLSNIRAAYAQAQTAYLTESSDGTNVVYTPATTDKEATVVVKGVVFKETQEGLNNLDQLPFGTLVNGGSGASDWKDKTILGGKAKSWDITFTYNANGAIDKVEAATAK